MRARSSLSGLLEERGKKKKKKRERKKREDENTHALGISTNLLPYYIAAG